MNRLKLYNLLFTRKEFVWKFPCKCALPMCICNVSSFKRATIIIKISVLSMNKSNKFINDKRQHSGVWFETQGTWHLFSFIILPLFNKKKKKYTLFDGLYDIRIGSLSNFHIFIDNFNFRNIFNFVLRRQIDHILDILFFFVFRNAKWKLNQ